MRNEFAWSKAASEKLTRPLEWPVPDRAGTRLAERRKAMELSIAWSHWLSTGLLFIKDQHYFRWLGYLRFLCGQGLRPSPFLMHTHTPTPAWAPPVPNALPTFRRDTYLIRKKMAIAQLGLWSAPACWALGHAPTEASIASDPQETGLLVSAYIGTDTFSVG